MNAILTRKTLKKELLDRHPVRPDLTYVHQRNR